MNLRSQGSRSGLTLLELLLVIAVVVILAAMIGPDFGDRCPGRSLVSRVRTDHRSLATAIESYYVDHNCYPGHRPLAGHATKLKPLRKARGEDLFTLDTGGADRAGLTTPVAYITSLFPDPFAPEPGLTFAYFTDGPGWILLSPGPDLDYDIVPERDYDGSIPQPSPHLLLLGFDPTNGTESDGDLWRVKQ
jgi:prepilin-type N-terminal cleavage/methylation domain-containing protein